MMERELRLGQCSYYVTNKAMQNEVITLEQFVTAIRSDRWKGKVEDYQRLMARGDKKGAKFIKDQMPCLVVAGVCSGGHSKENFRTFSGYLMFDVDHYQGDIRALMALLKAQPWMAAGWITISGEGLKGVVRVDARTQEEYEEQAYPLVAACIRKLIDFPVDMQCADLTRTCYASYDAEAFYKEEGCEVYPWREELAAFGLPAGEAKQAKPKGGAMPATTAQGMVSHFLEAFIETHPYVPNHRHTFHLALGREARRFGMDEEELKQLVELAVSRLAMPDCDGPEIRYNILDAYRFGEANALGEGRQQGFKGH